MGGGVFELGNPEGRGAQEVLEIQVGGGGGSKTVPSVMGVWLFSGMTHSCMNHPSQELTSLIKNTFNYLH